MMRYLAAAVMLLFGAALLFAVTQPELALGLARTATVNMQATKVTPDDPLVVELTYTLTERNGAVTTGKVDFWFDPVSKNTRYRDFRDKDTPVFVKIRNGLSLARYEYDRKMVDVMVADGDGRGFLLEAQGELLGYDAAVAQGLAQVVQQSITTNGRDTSVVEIRPQSRQHIEAMEVPHFRRAYVEKQFWIAIREEVHTIGADGMETLSTVQIRNLTRAERVPRAQMPANVFDAVPPADWYQSWHRYLTPDAASRFAEFDVFWAGPTFEGLPIFSITHDENIPPPNWPQQHFVRRSSVTMVYAHPFTRGIQRSRDQASVTTTPAKNMPLPDVNPIPLVTGQPLSEALKGYSNRLTDDRNNMMIMDISRRTSVEVSATTSEMTRRFFEALRKLN